ncbi:MAG: DUF1003 domain-containing protein [Cytophagales bacterium]|nr:DUF1003 domain-containing protein [Armatimonadota bacterium]
MPSTPPPDLGQIVPQTESTVPDERPNLDSPSQTTTYILGELHERVERDVNQHQRGIETITAFLGRPGFLYTSLAFVLIWISANLVLRSAGRIPFDTPPFFWLQGMIGTTALFTTTCVLIRQQREDRKAERREQLDLQISLLIEQETTKIISLLEELRRDLPQVRDRHDAEAEQFASTTDPKAMFHELDRVMNEANENARHTGIKDSGD